MRPFATALVLLLAVSAARAQTPGSCTTGTAEGDLDVSDVRARMFIAGNLFYGNSSANAYFVPRDSGKSPLYAAGLWIGGLVGGQLRVAGSTYDNFEFWPGPLNPGATLPNPSDCSAYDRIWVVSAQDVLDYEAGGTPTADLAEWPVALGAEAVDGDGDPDNYDLAAGDRPRLYGNQTAFWVMNDVGNSHQNSLTPPIGLEVQVTAFAIASNERALDRSTFYRYRLVNRNTEPFTDARFGFFADPDLGDATDDYVGTDTTRGMALVYNGDDQDGNGNGTHYGLAPPAIGYDLLDSASVSMTFYSTPGVPYSDPHDGAEMYNYLRALWRDGTPLHEGGQIGYGGSGPVTTFVYGGDPVTGAFWSERNIDGHGTANPPSDRRNMVASPAFTLAPGEARDVHLALVFGRGVDHLDSVTRLRAASDRIQTAFDDGSLLLPAPLPGEPAETLPAPALLSPADGAYLFGVPTIAEWTAVAGADEYRLEADTDSLFGSPLVVNVAATRGQLPGGGLNEDVTYFWRVRAEAPTEFSPYSEIRRYTARTYLPAFEAVGDGIVESASPLGDPCEGAPEDPGCAGGLGGNTVWHDTTGGTVRDYYVSGGGGDGSLSRLSRFIAITDGDDFEMRFTEAGGLALYYFTTDAILSVPFELWNTRRTADPADDVRMIPLVNPNTAGDEPDDWADHFTGADTWNESDAPVTDWVYWMMPDRADGYARFEAAAIGFGGPGTIYDGTADGDTQIDVNPASGQPCTGQGYYVDWCFRGGGEFVYPIGRVVFADLAGDGTTPPAGTVVRFATTDPPTFPVAAEPNAPEAPATYALLPAYPNPFNPTARLAFEAPRAGRVRLAVYDVLGREVVRLVDGPVAAGRHEAVLDGSRLASGVYLAVLTADGAPRLVRQLTLLK